MRKDAALPAVVAAVVMLWAPADIKEVFPAPPDVLHPGEGARILSMSLGLRGVHEEFRPLMEAVRARGVRIAMHGGFDSLNVATTSGIVLHHLAARRG